MNRSVGWISAASGFFAALSGAVYAAPEAAAGAVQGFPEKPLGAAHTSVEMSAGLDRVIRDTLREGPYKVIPLSDGIAAYEARNLRHRVHVSFGESGLQVRPLDSQDGEWKFGLALVSVGFEGDPLAVADPVLTARENSIEFHRQDVIEWYVNDDRGLEQGFTLSSPPPRRLGERAAGEVLEVRMHVTGSLAAELVDRGSAILLRDESGTAVLRVKDLFAFDAAGQSLPAEFALDGSRLALFIDTRGAVYPVTIDPLIATPQAKLTASDGTAFDQLGVSVALSGDTALVGAYADNFGQGSAYVFVRSGTVWSQQQKLTAAAGDDNFGTSVALSGNTALVAPGNVTEVGSAYIFERSGTVWSQQSHFFAGDAAANDSFGFSVALSGNTAMVGAYQDDGPAGSNQGSVYVYVRTGMFWNLDQQAKLTASDAAAQDNFGFSVALSGDTAVVGARGNDDAGSGSGSAYVFVRGANNVWDNGSIDQQAKLTASDAAALDEFGTSVAVDGTTALVGAWTDDTPAGMDRGSAYVFVRGANNVWDNGSIDQQAKLVASDAAGADKFFGSSVAVNGDIALVGEPGDEGPTGSDQGSAYVFLRTGTVWSEQPKLTASDGAAGDGFGWSVALGGDTALVGALGDDSPGVSDHGSAYVFTFVECATVTDCADGNACTCDQCTTGSCSNAPIEYGNVNCTGPAGQADIDDILCTLSGFAGFANCPNADIYPSCTGDGAIDLDDILAVLAAFGGMDPCGCLP